MQLCARAGVCSGIDYIRIMNVRFIFGLLAVGWLASQPLRARADMADNPYQPIVTRNVFALVPIPTNAPVDPSSLIPPPKITPNGIMTLFGNVQVLFKVAGVARPGMPPKDESYVMSVGDREDDIEVEKIDEKSATITFNNHGSIQELGLVPATDSGGGIPGAPPGLPMPGMGRSPGGFGRFGHSQNNPSYPSYPNANSAPVAAAEPSVPQPAPPVQPVMPMEQQVLMIEAQRLDYIQHGDPTAKILPPTEMTSQVTGEGGGDGGDAAPEPAPGN